MSYKFLDLQGLSRFLNKLKTLIPTKTSDLTNDSGFTTADSALSGTSENAVQNKVVKDALDGKANSSHTHTKSEITDFPTLATVATSGSYNDLSNIPTIPTVNNKTLTIQKNGTTVNTFTANSASDVTANITVPTAVSELQNDSGYLTSASNLDSSKLTGTIDIARLPAGALERLVTVADQTARYALTVNDVQLGDTVKQLDTGVMYIVTDESKLSSADGYTEYTAGTATSVPWSGVTGKPSDYTPSSHTHGSITNDGKLGTASKVLITDSNKKITTSSVSDTELGYLSGVTSSVQTQINTKANDSGVVHTTGNESISGTKSFNSDLNLNYASTDVDDIVDSIPGLGTVEDYVHISGAETISGVKTFSDGIVANVSGTATPLSHTHGNLTNDGKIGTTSNKPVITGTNGVLTAGAFGTSANTFCEGNDSRLSDARTPVSHSHGSISNDGKLANGNKVVITNSNKIITESSVTDTELGYLSGVTSSVQTQISTNDSNAVHITGDESISGTKSFNSDLNLNYANTDVSDIIDSTPGTGTSDIFVHNTGAETISGVKTFSDGIVANVSGNCTKDGSGNVITSTYGALSANNTWSGYNTFTKTINSSHSIALSSQYANVQLGAIPSTDQALSRFQCNDKDNDTLCYFRQFYQSSGTNTFQIFVRNKFANGTLSTSGTYDYTYLGIGIESDKSSFAQLKGKFIPYSTNTYDLGSSSYQWNNAYIKSLTINGVACGDILTHNVSEFVNVTGTQTIWGVKTFSSNVIIQGSKKVTCNLDNSFIELDGGTTWGKGGSIVLSGQDRSSSTNSVLIVSKSDTNTDILQYQNGELKPLSNNTNNPSLGTSTNKWKTFNGLNPGALSLPNFSADYDVSGQIVPPTGENQISINWGRNTFTPSVNGWLSVRIHKATSIELYRSIRSSYCAASRVESADDICVCSPVVAGVEYTIKIQATQFSPDYDHFRLSPCLGNV